MNRISHLVGYQQLDLGNSGTKKLLTPTFVNTTGEDYPIDNFVIIGATKDKQADLQVMNDQGAWAGHYYWFREYYNPKTKVTTPAGWFNGQGTVPAGVTIKPGYGVYMNVTANGLKVQSSGEVAGVMTNNLAVGKSLFGNASPVEIDIDKFEVVGATKDKQVDIQVMNDSGSWVGHYYWFREYYNPKTKITTPAGWFNGQGTVPAGITLKPGETAYVNVSAANIKLVIPTAL